ncbi:hypothetical protein AAFN88_07740 [Pelagibius sp. CAU 1746]|uniref:hypothetical protein n=1 Tax=Pelagibius sp. CAU 1746 TaxID=3140370 RepID=UPI00325AAA76
MPDQNLLLLRSGSAVAEIRLDRGACISALRPAEAAQNVLLENPEAAEAGLGDYDAAWIGGFDEICPTGAAATVGARRLEDHGVLWHEQWTLAALSTSSAEVECRPAGYPIHVRRQLELSPDSTLTTRHVIRNLSAERLPLIWGAHIGLPLGPDTIFDLGGDPLPDAWPPAPWPREGLPTGDHALHIFAAPPAGRIGVRSPGKPAIEIGFDPQELPWLHVWVSDGFLFGRRALCIEPFSAAHDALDTCIASGMAAWLPPAGEVSYRIAISLPGLTGHQHPLRTT